MPALPLLLPRPHSVTFGGPGMTLRTPVDVAGDDELALARVGRALDRAGLVWSRADKGRARIVLALDPAFEEGAQGYGLDIGAPLAGVNRARITAADAAGLFYGACTLAQLIDGDELPGVAIRDRPSLRKRGVMLDVSRDRVPTMQTLYGLIDLFADLKLNQLQLYTEHTFAYADHADVWRDADPLTADEVRALDGYCKERYIELVPNQQSFGHMHRWLKHERYRPLAEVPEGLEHPFSRRITPFSLCPGDARSLALIDELHGELLANFTSGGDFNVGCDETFDLGRGRSAVACRERGLGRVYLDHLLAVHGLVAKRGRRMQFWADILLSERAGPQLALELPRDCVPLIWGYEADHDFERETRIVAESGLPFFVCPGTGSWQSIGGRVENMLANVKSAVRHGLDRGAEGMLMTDWGDRGHLQPLPISYPGWAAAADLSWNADEPDRLDPDALVPLLDRFVLHARDAGVGRALVDLGRVDVAVDRRVQNGTVPFFLLMKDDRAEILEPAERERLLALLDVVEAGIRRPGGGALVADELRWACDVLRFGLRRDERGDAGLAALVAEHRRLWLERSRPGGLDDSCGWLSPGSGTATETYQRPPRPGSGED